MAETALAEAERRALAKKKNTQNTELVGSPLSGPNSLLAAMFCHVAAELRIKVIRQRDAALRVRMGKIAGDNHSLAYFQSQGVTAVVIALASSLHGMVDRRLPGFDFNPKVSLEWITQQKART